MKSLLTFLLFTSFCMMTRQGMAQEHPGRYMRIARIIVDSAQLDNYKAALREGMATAVKKESGVISLSAVYDKRHPTHVTVFEIYADENAYKAHIQTAHFLKYKATVQDMVKSLELIDVEPIALESRHE